MVYLLDSKDAVWYVMRTKENVCTIVITSIKGCWTPFGHYSPCVTHRGVNTHGGEKNRPWGICIFTTWKGNRVQTVVFCLCWDTTFGTLFLVSGQAVPLSSAAVSLGRFQFIKISK